MKEEALLRTRSGGLQPPTYLNGGFKPPLLEELNTKRNRAAT
jgi:hypothetical protein